MDRRRNVDDKVVYFFFAGSLAVSTALSAAAFAAVESLFASLAASLASLAAFDAAAASAGAVDGAGVTTVVEGGVTTVEGAVGAAGVTTTGVVAGRLSQAASPSAARAMQSDVLFIMFSFAD
jgi:triphosphoribosyl-dephospho-CoA synthetase